jgi:hypothetical protein
MTQFLEVFEPLPWKLVGMYLCIAGGICLLEGRPSPPYIGWHALGYKLVSIYPSWLQQGNLI